MGAEQIDPDYVGFPRLSTADILDAVRSGVILNDSGDSDEPLATLKYASSADGPKYNETDVDAVIFGPDLMDALTVLSTDANNPPHHAGLVLRKAVIVGCLDFGYLNLEFPLRFDGCVFASWINLDFATFTSLSLDNCAFEVESEHKSMSYGAINGVSVVVKNQLSLHAMKGLRQLFLPDCVIGRLSLSGDTLIDISQIGYGFRTVLDGARIDRLSVDTSLLSEEVTLKLPPLGSPTRIEVGSLQTDFSTDKKRQSQIAVNPDLLARWITLGSTGDSKRTAYSRQVWESFARALDQDAMNVEATRLRVLGRRFGRTKKRNYFAKAWDWVLDATIGYGYANHRAFLIWCGLFAATLVMIGIANQMDLMGDADNLQNPISLLLYSLGVVLSPVGTDGPQDWFFGGISPLFALMLSMAKISSLVLLGLFLSGLTGIINKR